MCIIIAKLKGYVTHKLHISKPPFNKSEDNHK